MRYYGLLFRVARRPKPKPERTLPKLSPLRTRPRWRRKSRPEPRLFEWSVYFFSMTLPVRRKRGKFKGQSV